MIYKVKLRLFQDDAHGEWGLAPANSININTPFNAFWSQQGIFHDVFEHYFEEVNPYFRGDNSFNVGGEIAAMGHLAWYWFGLGINGRELSRVSMWSQDELIIGSTNSMIQEVVEAGYCNFGSELLCGVPYQTPADGMIEYIAEEHWQRVKSLVPGKSAYDDEDRDRAREYKKSMTASKFQRLYRWGWKQAQKIAPRNDRSREIFEKFLEHWEFIVTKNSAEELGQIYKGIDFTIRTGSKLNWIAQWITIDNQYVDGKGKYPMEAAYELFSEENY